MTPIAFLRGMKRYGAKGFDAYAHHPYYGKPRTRRRTRARSRRGTTSVTMGNIDVLDRELDRLYGKRDADLDHGVRLPDDRPTATSSASPAKQAPYMRQAWTKAKRHPRIDMFIWFMLKDDTYLALGGSPG